jgi:hypothetical protein
MSVHKIVEQMGKVDPKNWVKIITPKKWLTVTPNWKCYGHSPIAPPQFGCKSNIIQMPWTILTPVTSHYTKLMKAKMFHKIIFKLNS